MAAVVASAIELPLETLGKPRPFLTVPMYWLLCARARSVQLLGKFIAAMQASIAVRSESWMLE